MKKSLKRNSIIVILREEVNLFNDPEIRSALLLHYSSQLISSMR